MTVDYLWRVLDYNPKTGIFIWKVDPEKDKRFNARYPGKRAGAISTRGYRNIRIYGKNYKEHRLAYYMMTGEQPIQIDHIDGDTGRNVFKNLRKSDVHTNKFNTEKRSNNKSGYKGVSLCSFTGRWAASIRAYGIHYRLGRFDSPEQAAAAYKKKAIELHGEFAYYDEP